MNKYLQRFLLNETIIYNGSISDFNKLINSKKDLKFNFEWESNSTFKVLAKISIGTMITYGSIYRFDGIKIIGKVSKQEDNLTQIRLFTKIRPEIYLIGVISLIFPLVYFGSNESLPFWLIILFPLVTIWFWIVYQYQEKILLKNLKDFIKNK